MPTLNVTVDITPAQQWAGQAWAAREGVTLDELVQRLLVGALRREAAVQAASDLNQRARALWAEATPQQRTAALAALRGN